MMEERKLLRGKVKKEWRVKLYLAAAFISTTILSSTGDAVLEVYRNVISENVAPALKTVWFQLHGIFNPIQEHHDYHFSVTFYIPPSGGKAGGSENTGVSVPGEACRKYGGITSSSPSSLNFENWQNNVITEVYCSSGRVTVTLIPQTGGEKQIIYDGYFNNGKQISFSGASGRYNAGVLNLISTDRSEPVGDWFPINECQKSRTCS
ncbi:TPA: hypothetical protein O8L23_003828 [Enterobacter cloacae]|uniref:hypothetical protein n=1 Tax=Klebsiella pneumoniae TaxID=573 RepID=UPI0011430FA6|nr:hypothetical protein [Klebsiella pneumoniae]MCE0123150.1 hypothetical protein [Klebsiella pneumoniae]MCE0306995.1 hypothetical protein [Klebsiella pneumoniae]WGU85140.1 hypothetical protein QG930_17255 [Klebsiella pneumoniae]HDC4279236.1 hypothetical protein [Enterobacter cloacae]